MAVPAIGTKHAIIQTRHRRFFHFAAKREKQIEHTVDITPVGMARREDSRAVNPKLLMIIPLKVMSPIVVSEFADLVKYHKQTNRH
jgi:hypothetical protein